MFTVGIGKKGVERAGIFKNLVFRGIYRSPWAFLNAITFVSVIMGVILLTYKDMALLSWILFVLAFLCNRQSRFMQTFLRQYGNDLMERDTTYTNDPYAVRVRNSAVIPWLGLTFYGAVIANLFVSVGMDWVFAHVVIFFLAYATMAGDSVMRESFIQISQIKMLNKGYTLSHAEGKADWKLLKRQVKGGGYALRGMLILGAVCLGVYTLHNGSDWSMEWLSIPALIHADLHSGESTSIVAKTSYSLTGMKELVGFYFDQTMHSLSRLF